MKNLFEEFQKVNRQEWLEKIEKDLKGKSIDILASRPEHDLEIVAYHHHEDLEQVSNPILRKEGNNWYIRQDVSNKNNKDIIAILNEGVDSIGFDFENRASFERKFEEVKWEHILGDVSVSDLSILKEKILDKNISINYDILGRNAQKGNFTLSMETYLDFVKKYPNNSIWVNGSIYGNAGATSVEELGMTLSHLNEYLQTLKDNGHSIEEFANKIRIELSVGDNYFVNIAKFRAIHLLVKSLLKGYGVENGAIELLYAKTAVRYQAKNDRNTNLLRETTQAMSAIIGGCDVLTVTPFLGVNENENLLSERMAKNIQLVLKEESYLDKVADAGAGSYYIEDLTNQLIEKSWKLFLEFETNGGFIVSIKNNQIQEKIDYSKLKLIEQVNKNEKTFLGVNKFKNNMEDWKQPEPKENRLNTEFFAISEFRMEDYYEPKAVVNE